MSAKSPSHRNIYITVGNAQYRVVLGLADLPLVVAKLNKQRRGDGRFLDVNSPDAARLIKKALEKVSELKKDAEQFDESINPDYSGWMQTYSGEAFFPLAPEPNKIHLIDIAQALSLQCRYAGHCRDFFSTAEHSWLMAKYIINLPKLKYDIRKRNRLAAIALLHDSPEAYLFDAHKGIKKHIAGMKGWEATLQTAIYKRFGMEEPTAEEYAFIKELDMRITMDERNQNMQPSKLPWALQVDPLGVTLHCFDPRLARAMFLSLCEDVGIKEQEVNV